MSDEAKILTEFRTAEAVNAQAVVAEAAEKARQAENDAAIKHRADTLSIFAETMREILTEGESGTSAILVRRIPFICNDIIWIKRAVIGLYALLGTIGTALIISALIK